MANVNRREFLHSSKKTILHLAAGAAILGQNRPTEAAEEGRPKKRPDVMTIYYPHWHSYDHGTAWKGEGWTEWDEMKVAPPRFPGHHQPLQPTWARLTRAIPNGRNGKLIWPRRMASTCSSSIGIGTAA